MTSRRRTSLLFLPSAAATVLCAPLATDASAQSPTYTRDVAPIIQAKCQECHREGSIGPIRLTNYDEVRHHSRAIGEKVEARLMPPWHIDRTVGIQEFANDRGLTPEEYETVLEWVRLTPYGDPDDLPEAPDFGDPYGFKLAAELGEPDYVARSESYGLEAEPRDAWFRSTTPTGFPERRWVKAIEVRPVDEASRRVVHHALVFLRPAAADADSLAGPAVEEVEGAEAVEEVADVEADDELLEDEVGEEVAEVEEVAEGPEGPEDDREPLIVWSAGMEGDVLPGDAGRPMPSDSEIEWEIHTRGIDEAVDSVAVELGVWFYAPDEEPMYRTRLRSFDARGPTGLDISPGEVAVTQEYHTLRRPTRVESFQPRMHMRGRTMQLEAVYPDGRTELLSRVDDFDGRWNANYVYADHAAPLLPPNTTLIVTAWHDNTPENPRNPDPAQWVGWGERLIDEQAHAWIGVTYLSKEEFDAEVAEREAVGSGGR